MGPNATLTVLLHLLDQGELLLLPNGRAARELRSAYDAQQRAKGLFAWQPARALSWQQWTGNLYNELIISGVESRLLLNAAQEQWLWSAVIDDDAPEGLLISSESLAELAASALQLAAAWNATSQLSATATNDDTRTFARWARAFEDRCIRDHYLSTARLDTGITQHITAGTLRAMPQLHLVGFDKLMPSQQHLLNALQNRNTDIEHIKPAAANTQELHATFTASNPREELELAAYWLHEQLTSRHTHRRIAVLVPHLAEEHAEIEAVFRDILTPELQSIDADLSSTPWEFSTGSPLSSLALIADALDLARWSIAPLPQPRLSALLLSPYLNPGNNRELAAQLDARLRRREKRLLPELSLNGFLHLLDDHRSTLTWPRQLAMAIARTGDLSRSRTYAAWMEFVRSLIQATGWPNSGERPLNPTEFEATRAWDRVLDLVATLDFNGRSISLETAIDTLARHVQAATFIPPSTSAPIQIMRPADIEGAIFDAVLFLRATDVNLPAAEHTHPLLSWTLQSSLNMPGTDPLRSATQAHISIQSLLDRTGAVLFTAAAEDASGELRSSPLLEKFDLQKEDFQYTEQLTELREPATGYDLIADVTPIPAPPTDHVYGGSGVLKAQSACGFRAFAEFRLLSAEPDTNDVGLDAAESGSRIHRAMQIFWTRIGSQQALRELSAEARQEQLRFAIDTVLANPIQSDEPWELAYLDVQRDRLLALLEHWLDCELERGPFTVFQQEHEQDISVGPITVKARFDRIDKVGDRFFLVDYKTGAGAHPSVWEGERPDDPQLPLYAVEYQDYELAGLAFANIRAGSEMKWLGYQAEPGQLPASRTNRVIDFNALLPQWRATLTRLAEDFAAGRANVNPHRYPHTCKYCRQRLLCRLDPADLHSTEDDAEFQEDNDA